MTVLKDDLHALVDRLPEAEAAAAARYLQYLIDVGERPATRAWLTAPEDDEPLAEGDIQALREARADLEAGRVYKHEQAKAILLSDES